MIRYFFPKTAEQNDAEIEKAKRELEKKDVYLSRNS